MKYLGHGNAGLVLVNKNHGSSSSSSTIHKQLIKFIPCQTRNDCISIAGYEGLCTLSVASLQLPFFPSVPSKIEMLTPEEFRKQWFPLFQKQKYPLPKRWKQSDPKATWLNRDWHVLVIYSKEYLHDKLHEYTKRSPKDKIYVLCSIFAAIQNAQFHFQMVHGDLHPKNVMIRKRAGDKKLVFRKSHNTLYELDFGPMDYDVVVVDWEKATSSKLFGSMSMHAHLQRMLPVFFKHKLHVVPCHWLDINMVLVEMYSLLDLFPKDFTSVLDTIMDSVDKKDYMYPVGIYPVDFVAPMQDPLWITNLVQQLVQEYVYLYKDDTSFKDSTLDTILPHFNNTPLPPWTSKEDFFEHFMKEYFQFKKPIHRYMLPPFEWEKKQFHLLVKDLKDMYGIDVSSWPTSVPRPILSLVKKYGIVRMQLLVMRIYFQEPTAIKEFKDLDSAFGFQFGTQCNDIIKEIQSLYVLSGAR